MDHAGPFAPLMGLVQGGGLSGEDGTGRVSAGPQGFSLTRRGKDGRDDWNLSVNPMRQSLQLGNRDVGASVNWNANSPSGGLRLGNVRLSGGYGQAPGGSGTPVPRSGTDGQFLDDGIGRNQPAKDLLPAGQPGHWGRIDFTVGQPGMAISAEAIPGIARAKGAQAVAPWEAAQPMSARDALNAQLKDYEARNPYFWWDEKGGAAPMGNQFGVPGFSFRKESADPRASRYEIENPHWYWSGAGLSRGSGYWEAERLWGRIADGSGSLPTAQGRQ